MKSDQEELRGVTYCIFLMSVTAAFIMFDTDVVGIITTVVLGLIAASSLYIFVAKKYRLYQILLALLERPFKNL